MSRLVVSMIEFPYEISPNWLTTYEMPVATREDNYKQEIISTLNYLELKKLKKLIANNRKEPEETHSPKANASNANSCAVERFGNEITKDIGAVIY